MPVCLGRCESSRDLSLRECHMVLVRGGTQLILPRDRCGMMFNTIDFAPHVLLLMLPFSFPFPLSVTLSRDLRLSLSLYLSVMLTLLLLLFLVFALSHVLLNRQSRRDVN